MQGTTVVGFLLVLLSLFLKKNWIRIALLIYGMGLEFRSGGGDKNKVVY
jgi:hypothetical protein